jgi:predicted ATPase
VAFDYEFLKEHDWFMENDGMYRDEYDMVMQKDYKQAVKDVLEGNQSFGWSQNEERFIKRLKPEDLPLFVNFEWLNRDAYEAKMKEVL